MLHRIRLYRVIVPVSDIDDGVFARASAAGAKILRPVAVQPWGERSFYCADPFGNKLCFVDSATLFTAGLI